MFLPESLKCAPFWNGKISKLFTNGKKFGNLIFFFCIRYLVLTIFFTFFRYASLYFCAAVEQTDNELVTLEVIHRYVELLDKYFGSVSSFFFLNIFIIYIKSHKYGLLYFEYYNSCLLSF